MIFFELPLTEGNPTNIKSFELHLQAAPPELKEKNVEVSNYIPKNKRVQHIQYKDACFDEGCLNFCIVRYESENCQIHFFGNISGKEMAASINLNKPSLRNYDIMTERVKFILSKSKTILKSYYQAGKVRNIQHHLLSFLGDIK